MEFDDIGKTEDKKKRDIFAFGYIQPSDDYPKAKWEIDVKTIKALIEKIEKLTDWSQGKIIKNLVINYSETLITDLQKIKAEKIKAEKIKAEK
jgi:hypothetical protein